MPRGIDRYQICMVEAIIVLGPGDKQEEETATFLYSRLFTAIKNLMENWIIVSATYCQH